MKKYTEKTGTFQTEDGLSLFYRHIFPKKSPVKDRIIINHGIGESSMTYEYLIDALTAESYDVWMYEMRGHGLSPGTRGHAESIDELSRDLNTFVNFVEPGKKKLFLLGHSLGALVALNYIINYGEKKIKGLIVNGAGLLIEETFSIKLKKTIGKFIRIIAPSFTMSTGIKNDTLSGYAEYLKKRAQNNLLHTRVSASLGIALLDEGKKLLFESGKIKLPILITHGGSDTITNQQGSIDLYRGVSSRDKNMHIYPGLKHEIYNENEKKVFSDLTSWLKKHTKKKS